MQIPFIGGAYSGRSPNINAQVCQNWYSEVDRQDGKHPISLMPTPGSVEYLDMGLSGEVRALYAWKNGLYAVVGASVVRACGSTTNLITNGNMELDSDWYDYSFVGVAPTTNERSTDQAYTGSYSRKIVQALATDGIKSATFTTVTGRSYTYSVAVYPYGTDVTVYVRKGDDSGSNGGLHTGLTAGAWNVLTGTFTETAGGASAYFAIFPTTGTGTFYVDDVTLYAAEVIGTLTTSTGRVWIAAGTNHIMFVDGTAGYYTTETGTSVTTITDLDFPATPTSLAYQDGYFIVTEDNSDLFYISALEDASSWDGLDFASAEDTPDDALCVISHNRELWVFGEQSTEVFYNSGDTDFPFSRVAGGVFKVGVGAVDSIAAGPEGIFGLDHRYQVRMIVGYQGHVISTPQIEYHIQSYATKSDAIGYVYNQEGHSFYVLTFPTESKTWVYDITTGLWHTRSSGSLVTNGSMELDSSWSDYSFPATNERSTTQVHGGTYSRKLVTTTSPGGIQSATFTTVSGARYRLTAWIYPSTTSINIVIFSGVGGGTYCVLKSYTLTANMWNRVSFDYVDPSGGASASVVFFNSGTVETFYIDDVSVISSGARHRGNCYCWYDDKHLIGDYSDGKIYELDLDTYTDRDEPIERIRAAQAVHQDRKLLYHSKLEIEFEAGVGSSQGQATGYAVVSAAGVVTGVTISSGGAGYSVAPIVKFEGGGGYGAVATATITAGAVTSVTVLSGGSGYYSRPKLTFVENTQNPEAVLDWSDDGGHTWSNQHIASFGAVDDYTARAVWRRLGRSRSRVYRVTVIDSVKPVILSANLDAQAGTA